MHKMYSRFFNIKQKHLTVYFVIICIVSLIAAPSRVGDGLEYVAMTKALSEFRLPAYSSAELQDFYKWADIQNYIGFKGVRLEFPSLVGFDGRQDFPHFWFYSLLAVPFWWLLSSLHLPILYSFTLLNITLLSLSLRIGLTIYKPLSLLLVLASPIIWFVNKAHTEVFTFSLTIIGVTLASGGNFLIAAAVFAAAATQNIPWIPLVFLFLSLSIIQKLYLLRSSVNSRFLITPKSILELFYDGKEKLFKYLFLFAFSIFISLIHIFYYFIRIKFVTPQLASGAAVISSNSPNLTEYFAVLIDPDIGLISNLPIQSIFCLLVAIFLFASITIKFRSIKSYNLDNQLSTAIGFTLFSIWLLFSFSKTTNFNSGATINISRYGLWFIPMMLPYFHIGFDKINLRIWNRFKIFLKFSYPLIFVFYIFYCSPFLHESYLSQTYLSRKFYDFFPCGYQPVPEIFIDRNTGVERESLAVSNPSCSLTFSKFGVFPGNCKYTEEEVAAIGKNVSIGKFENWIVRKGSLNLCVPKIIPILDTTYKSIDIPSLDLSKSDLLSDTSTNSSLNIYGLSGIELDQSKNNLWRWALGPKTSIIFNLNESKPLDVVFEFNNPIQGQEITFEFNGKVLDSFNNLDQNEIVERRIKLNATQGINRIVFKYKYWNHNQVVFAANDPRFLSISFKHLRINSITIHK